MLPLSSTNPNTRTLYNGTEFREGIFKNFGQITDQIKKNSTSIGGI